MEAEKKSVVNTDLIITLTVACVCVYMLFAATPFQFLGKLFPQVIAGATLAACVAQIFLTIKKSGQGKTKKSAKAGNNNYIGIVAISAIYLAVLPFAGFILSTLALTVAVPMYLGNKNKKVVWAVGVILTIGSYFVFKSLFFVPLPQGILTFI